MLRMTHRGMESSATRTNFSPVSGRATMSAGWFMLSTTTRRPSSRTLRGREPNPTVRRLLWTTAAAATAMTTTNSLLPSGASAFVVVQPYRTLQPAALPNVGYHGVLHHREAVQRQSRTFVSSQRGSGGSDGDGEGGFLSKVGSAVKSVLPASWFQSEPEKRAAIERKRVQDEISGGLTDLLKDAPFPIRMVGNLVKPLISTAMSSLAETMAEQQETVSSLMIAAQLCLESDERVEQLLGSGGTGRLQVSNPFSQSSSTSSINGQTTSRVDLAFEVYGPVQSGVVRLSASNGKITQLTVQAASGRVLEVRTSPSKRSRSRVLGNDDDNTGTIIEAEIIEKKPRP